MRTDLGTLSDLEAVDKLLPVAGLSLVEVGCAAGDTARALAGRGATVLGLEPDSRQAEKNRAASPTPGVTFAESGGESVPVADASADGVLFFRSLHHVPIDLMDTALAEAARILKPGGFLYIAEPALTGTYSIMTRPFNDETEVRTRAQQVLDATAPDLLGQPEKFFYTLRIQMSDFETMATSYITRSFNSMTRDMIDVPEVREKFAAGRCEDGYAFDQPMLVNLYRLR
jgi:SAM-dependent methyltransferase